MRREIQEALYFDEQAAVPAGYCHVCGGELYGTYKVCIRCERGSEA